MHLKKLLGMVIHMNYLQFSDELDVINDFGNRFIVSRDDFLASIHRLLLSHHDTCLIACARAHEACATRIKADQAIEPVQPDEAEFRDLHRLLSNVSSMPELLEVIWNTYFKNDSVEIDAKEVIANNQPFINGSRATRSELAWRIGWRRDNSYSNVWVNVVEIIATIREHIQNN